MLNLTTSDQTTILILAVLTYSMALTLRLGLFSIAPAGYAGVGAYVTGILIVHEGWTFAPAAAAATAACGLLALAIAIPLSRVSGIYTSIATLAFVVVGTGVENTLGITGGSIGLIGIPYEDLRWLLLVTLAICVLVGLVFDLSNFGRKRDVLGHDVVLGTAIGMRVGLNRTAGIVAQGMLAGWAGAIYAVSFYVLEPNSFSFLFAIKIAAYTVVGGVTFWAGPLLGGLLMGLLSAELRNFPNWGDIAVGTVMVITIVAYPTGLSGPLRRLFRRRFRPSLRFPLSVLGASGAEQQSEAIDTHLNSKNVP